MSGSGILESLKCDNLVESSLPSGALTIPVISYVLHF